MQERQMKVVKAGFVPAIHVSFAREGRKDADSRELRHVHAVRAKQAATPGHDVSKGSRRPRSVLARLLMSLPAAAISLFASSLPAFADLKLCNRMSYVVEAAIGIDDKSATATRGWFRIDPAACRVVLQGALTADRVLLNARALGVYGASPIPQNGNDTLCVAPENFVIAAARQCRGNQTPAPFTQITPTRTDDGNLVADRGAAAPEFPHQVAFRRQFAADRQVLAADAPLKNVGHLFEKSRALEGQSHWYTCHTRS